MKTAAIIRNSVLICFTKGSDFVYEKETLFIFVYVIVKITAVLLHVQVIDLMHLKLIDVRGKTLYQN